MIINELRFASGYVDGEGTSHGFDDLGCLAHYCRSHGLADSGPDLWVMDFHERTWKRATDAWFVRCDSMPTPMGYGFVALGDSLEAGRIAVPGTGRLRFDAFRRHVIEDQTSAATKE
ncbi:MAG TPA: hypothetical protein VFH88_15005 [Candidatus Krumholzibacteria bacterium]|nr:hypothetical protein [Candidatus Krumholzibacteria bacterium]